MTTKPKGILFITLLLLAGLFLSACGGAPQPSAPAEAPDEEETIDEEENGEEENGDDEENGEEENGDEGATEDEDVTATDNVTETEEEAAEESDDAAVEPSGETETAIIGFTASLTGKYNVESTRQNNGMALWMEAVNSAGGVVLADGTAVMFESQSYDDESNKERVQELYTRLATEDNANFLISPYSSGLTAAAAVIAEQNGRVMITTGAASDETYEQGFTLVYQVYTPASRYLTGAIDMMAEQDAEMKKIAIIYENSNFSTSVVEAARTYAEEQGYEIVLFEGYDPGTTDFAPIINKVQQSEPDAILGGGHFQDGSTLAKQIAEKNVDVGFMALLVAPPDPAFAELGDAAVGVVGPSQWEPQASYTPDAADAEGIEWIGISGDEFVSAYEAAYGEEPSYHAAGGYIAGLVLQHAIEEAGSTETEAVSAALDAMDVMTFYGHIKFATSEEQHGLQTGHDMVYAQWQQEGGDLLKEIVWPSGAQTSDPIIIER